MLTVNSYDGVCRTLGDRFRTTYSQKDVNLTGLIFGLPNSPVAKTEFLPFVDYWYHRSDNVTDFLCAGFGEYDFGSRNQPADAQHVPEVTVGGWWFSTQVFVEFVEELERLTTWTYRGGLDVIVCTARWDGKSASASLDFASSIVVSLEDAKKCGAVRDLSDMLTDVFEFAKSINEAGSDVAWKWSDEKGMRILRSTLKEGFYSLFPKWLSAGGKKAEHFAVRDISRRAA